MNNSNHSLGLFGENIAATELKKEGYEILAIRYQTRYGEIDLIAKRNQTLCFVEVKTRRSLSHGSPEEAVHDFKARRMVMAAQHYLQNHPMRNIDETRFDVMAIIIQEGKEPIVRWFQNVVWE